MRWVHDANCFLSRDRVDPARRSAVHLPSGSLDVVVL